MLRGGYALGLNDVDYNFEFWMELRSTGQNLITGGTTVLSFTNGFDDEGDIVRDPVFTHTWVTGLSVQTSGVFNGQFRVVRTSDEKIMFLDKFLLRRYPTI